MRIKYILFFSIIFLPVFAIAQISRDGSFEVDEIRGCASFTVNIINTNLRADRICGSGSDACRITWGDGTFNQDDGIFSHTYSQPGPYRIAVNYQTIGTDVLDITVDPNTQPAFNIFTCSGNEVQISITDTNYDSYIINYNDATPEVEVPRGALALDNHMFGSGGTKTIQVRGKNNNAADNCTPPAVKTVPMLAVLPVPDIDRVIITSSSVIDLEMTTQQNILYRLEMAPNGGGFQNLGNLHNVNTATIPSLDTDNNFYCFRLGVVDPCTGSVNYSPVICSADLSVTAQNNANQLTWITSTTDVLNFTVNRDGNLLTTTSSTTFLDTDVECKTEYCYQIITNYAGGRSISTERCVTAISTDIPTAINNISSEVNGSSVDLTWQEDAVFQAETFQISRQSNGGSYSLLEDNITTSQYTDADYAVTEKYCYRVNYVDICGNTSNTGISACPIILEYTSGNENEIILSWSSYTGWAAGVDHYELNKYNLQHSLLETFSLGSATTYTDNDLTDQGYYYKVRAIPNDGANEISVSNEVNAVRKLRFAYPKAFTPDKQGPIENETFKVFVTTEFIDHFEMKIFNRWGEMIFSTTDLLQGWDGRFNGTPQPEGTYTFTATLKDKTGRVFKRDGSVMLLRKKQ